MIFRIKGIFHSFYIFLKTCYEKDHSRFILWWPVVFGLGILAYFSLNTQPSLLIISLFCVSSVLGLFFSFIFSFRLIGIGILGFSFGFLAIHIRTIGMGTEMINTPILSLPFSGIVSDIDYTPKGVRLILHLDQHPLQKINLNHIRVSLKQSLPLPPLGAKIRGDVTLFPFGGVMSASGYQFRKMAYFQGLSATGRLLRYSEIPSPPNHQEGKFSLIIKKVRKAITDNIRTQFSFHKDEGAIMAALVTGVRGEISPPTRQAFTDAGLAHLLAISGLHLSLIAGIIFLCIRRGLALSIIVAERWNLKKIAAVLTLPFLLFYLLISGIGIPALRSFLMIFIGMMAILIDRNPLSMRLVCFAASVILLIYPESLLSASFQLSFAAVFALIGVYEIKWFPFKPRNPSFFSKGGRYILGIIATTVIASYATTPFTIAIFQRFSLQAIGGNLVAIPMTGFIILPLIVLFLFFSIGGLEFLITPFLKKSIQILIETSVFIASLPGAGITLPEQPPSFLILFTSGGIWFCLWKQPWRHFGWVLMIFAFLCIKRGADPVIVIPDKEQAIYGFDGHQAFSVGKATPFSRDLFLRQTGVASIISYGHTTIHRSIEDLTLFLTTEKLPANHLKTVCQKADYLFSPRSIWYSCQKNEAVIDRFTLKHQGTMIATLTQGKVHLLTSCALQGCRPWSEAKCCQS